MRGESRRRAYVRDVALVSRGRRSRRSATKCLGDISGHPHLTPLDDVPARARSCWKDAKSTSVLLMRERSRGAEEQRETAKRDTTVGGDRARKLTREQDTHTDRWAVAAARGELSRVAEQEGPTTIERRHRRRALDQQQADSALAPLLRG